MRRKPLWKVTLASGLCVAIGAFLYRVLLGPRPVVRIATDTGTMLAEIRQWFRLAVAHASPVPLAVGAGVAWFIFVLALLIHVRSDQGGPPGDDSLDGAHNVQRPSIASNPDRAPLDCSPLRRSVVYPYVSRIPPLPRFPTTRHPARPPSGSRAEDVSADTITVGEFTDDLQAGSTAVQLWTDDRCRIQGKQPQGSLELTSHPSVRTKNGYLLALTGVAPRERQLVPYGLFLVAEDVGATSSSGEASRQTIEAIATDVAPLLAINAALGSEHLTTLFKMAVLRASMALRHQSICTATDLEAAVAGMMIIGNDVYIVNVGHCRTYLFRPDAGLNQVSIDHSVISCLVGSGLLPPEALNRRPRRNQIYRSVGGNQTAAEVDTFALHARHDDQLVLCSPSLWQSLSAREMEAIVRIDTDPRSTAERLSRAASRHGGDTASAIVVRPVGGWVPEFGIPAA